MGSIGMGRSRFWLMGALQSTASFLWRCEKLIFGDAKSLSLSSEEIPDARACMSVTHPENLFAFFELTYK
jgi:hypothetical protein